MQPRIPGYRTRVLEGDYVSLSEPAFGSLLFTTLFTRFMNIITSLRGIFDTLGADDELHRRTSVSNTGRSSNDGLGHPTVVPPVSSHLLKLRYRLMPLLSMEEPLAKWLQVGYIDDQQTGKQQIYVRRRWRSIVSDISSPRIGGPTSEDYADEDIVTDVSSILLSSKDDIAGLWDLPDTQRLIKIRKLHMSEAASLCASFHDMPAV